MRVRFEFPLPVTISQVQLGWMWGHNGQHWFDMAEISAGNSAGELKSVCTFPNPGDRKQNSTVFAISFPKPVTARCFEVTITQKAALGRFLFSISEISLCGPESQLEKLRSAGNRETGSLEFERHAPCNIFDSAKTVEPGGARGDCNPPKPALCATPYTTTSATVSTTVRSPFGRERIRCRSERWNRVTTRSKPKRS